MLERAIQVQDSSAVWRLDAPQREGSNKGRQSESCSNGRLLAVDHWCLGKAVKRAHRWLIQSLRGDNATDGSEDNVIHCLTKDGPVPSDWTKLQQALDDKELAELFEELDPEQEDENVMNVSDASIECWIVLFACLVCWIKNFCNCVEGYMVGWKIDGQSLIDGLGSRGVGK